MYPVSFLKGDSKSLSFQDVRQKARISSLRHNMCEAGAEAKSSPFHPLSSHAILKLLLKAL